MRSITRIVFIVLLFGLAMWSVAAKTDTPRSAVLTSAMDI